MKLIKVMDKEGEKLVADPTNTTILRELVTAEHSAAELAEKLKIPTLNVWRRMQKLQKAKLIEHTTTQKVGNLEKKLYRSTATYFTPQQYFNFTPKNPALTEAFELYNQIQRKMMTQTATYDDVPKDADPVDYAFFVNMMVFADVCSQPDVQAKIIELKNKLSKFTPPTRVV
jgi:DNA-binding Lrp family transcriptional regulator